MEDGRLQVLDIAWDSRRREAGGQRWFHLHPDERIRAGALLHWTGPNLNWNYMCADCHSTNLRKGLDASTGVYRTTWSEMDVSCEACHGPGSLHREWALALAAGKPMDVPRKGLTVVLDERKGVHWLVDDETGQPRRSVANERRTEIEVCARCHSRRSQLTDDWYPGQPFLDAYRPMLLDEPLYHADGQARDENYVWGSFVQSRMYQAGVTCSDCHDPHRADLRLPGEQVCYQCHRENRYASRQHHFHDEGKAGVGCIECHMPATTFMGVDRRHDHGFRIPRPDLTVSLGVPNACNRCHSNESAQWALEKVEDWYGHRPQGYQRFAQALHKGRQGQPGSLEALLDLAGDVSQPVIARATALGLLRSIRNMAVLTLMQRALEAEDPLLRLGALKALVSASPRMRLMAFPLVWDERKAVRIEAARMVAGYPRDGFEPGQIRVLDAAIEEYIQSQEFNGDRPEAQVNLGDLYQDMKKFEQAEAAYRKAIRLQPRFVPAYVNLAQMLSSRGLETDAVGLLRSGIRQVPDSAVLYHTLGLSLVRSKKAAQAVSLLGRAADLDKDNMRYTYVYAVALHSLGKTDKALSVLSGGLARHPGSIDLLLLLVAYNQEKGDLEQALLHAHKIQEILPGNPDVKGLIRKLEAGSPRD
jgi:predicted CXXCH cytochrome family protein